MIHLYQKLFKNLCFYTDPFKYIHLLRKQTHLRQTQTNSRHDRKLNQFEINNTDKQKIKLDQARKRLKSIILLQRWYKTVLNTRLKLKIKNTTDPITMDQIRGPPFILCEIAKDNSRSAFQFDPESLAQYFISTKKFQNPLTRKVLNTIELKRLNKLINRRGIKLPSGDLVATDLAKLQKESKLEHIDWTQMPGFSVQDVPDTGFTKLEFKMPRGQLGRLGNLQSLLGQLGINPEAIFVLNSSFGHEHIPSGMSSGMPFGIPFGMPFMPAMLPGASKRQDERPQSKIVIKTEVRRKDNNLEPRAMSVSSRNSSANMTASTTATASKSPANEHRVERIRLVNQSLLNDLQLFEQINGSNEISQQLFNDIMGAFSANLSRF